MKTKPITSFSRSSDNKDTLFGSYYEILKKRLENYHKNAPGIITFYQKLYNNVLEIDVERSKLFIEDRLVDEISQTLEAKQEFAKDYFLRESKQKPCKVRNMHVDRCLMK